MFVFLSFLSKDQFMITTSYAGIGLHEFKLILINKCPASSLNMDIGNNERASQCIGNQQCSDTLMKSISELFFLHFHLV